MSAGASTRRPRVVLFEGRGSGALEASDRFALLSGLLADGHAVTRATGSTAVAAPDDTAHLVLGRFEDAPPGDSGAVQFLEIGALQADAVREQVRSRVAREDAPAPGAWKPWFPVIDFDRCTNCMQCLTFCLFDVYGVDGGGTIEVANQQKCKTDCPACSRVCPEAAIMFPKYKQGPINGAEVREEDLDREAMKVDISALLGGDLYAALRTRSDEARKRFSTERDESKALLERKRCLAKLGSQLDIPDEVLMTLPSAGDIEERARRAREKAERRKERSRTMQDRRPASEEEWGI